MHNSFKILPLVDNTLSSLCLVYKLISGVKFSKIGILFIVYMSYGNPLFFRKLSDARGV
jgi:hypothetical protein